MNDNYFEKCHVLMDKLSKQNKQMIKLQLDNVDLQEENEQLKQQVKQLQHWNKCLAEKRHNELKGDV